MQRYLQMDVLRRQSLQHFDAWAGTFGETVTAMELAPDGAGYRLHTRFARFVNVPELMQMFRSMADVQTADMLKLPIPALDGGKARIGLDEGGIHLVNIGDAAGEAVEAGRYIGHGQVDRDGGAVLAHPAAKG